MSILQMTKAIAAREEDGWRYRIGNRIVVRSLDGCCLRGLEVDRTSTPGEYRIYACTQTWMGVADCHTFTMAFQVGGSRRFGDHTSVGSQVGPYLESDPDVRRVVFAAPDDPVFISPASWFRADILKSVLSRTEYALIRAWEGDVAFALPELLELQPEIAERMAYPKILAAEPYWDDWCGMIAELIACLRAGKPARDVIEPRNEAARARLKITPIKPPRRL